MLTQIIHAESHPCVQWALACFAPLFIFHKLLVKSVLLLLFVQTVTSEVTSAGADRMIDRETAGQLEEGGLSDEADPPARL